MRQMVSSDVASNICWDPSPPRQRPPIRMLEPRFLSGMALQDVTSITARPHLDERAVQHYRRALPGRLVGRHDVDGVLAALVEQD